MRRETRDLNYFTPTAVSPITDAHEIFVKEIPITLYHQLIPGEHEITFSRRSLYFIILSSIAGVDDVLTSNNSSQ